MMATNSSTTVQHFRTTPKLLAVLQLGGATCQLFTADQIVLYLGKYIENKKLFNPSNKRVIRCKNDLLGEVFRVNQFTVTDFKDLWKLLFPCLLPATRREVSNSLAQETPPPIEQPSTSNSDGDSELPWWYFISPRRSKEEDSNTGTEVGSYHERETLEAHDSEYESEIDEMIEYEPADSDSEVSDADTEPVTSDEEDVTALHRLKEFQSDEETTTTDASLDSDIMLEEQWICPECHTRNSPKVGYCQGCWKLRKDWVEDKRMQRSMTDPMALSQETPPSFPERSISLDVSDGRTSMSIGSSSSIVPTLPSFMVTTPPNSLKHKLPDNQSEESMEQEPKKMHFEESMESAGGSRSESIPSEISSTSNSSSDLANFPGLCNICRNYPNDATMIHGNIAHQFCCFRCAKRLKRKGKSCPVCRQPIMLVIRNYIVQQ